MTSLNGYVTHDIKSSTLSGWTKGIDKIRALYDGMVVGETEAGDLNESLQKVMPGAQDFEMACAVPFTPLDIVSKRLTVIGESPSGETLQLKLTDARFRFLVDSAINEVLGSLPEGAREPVRQTALTWPQVVADQLAAGMDRGEVATQYVPANLRSPNNDVMIGYGNHLFYIGGDLVDRYDGENFDFGAEGLDGVVAGWKEVLEERRILADRYEAAYAHVVIPEKLTALRRYSPLPIDGPTAILEGLSAQLGTEPWYVDALTLFERWHSPEDPYPTTDSHLSASGARAVMKAVADRVDPMVAPLMEALPMREVAYVQGDLSRMMQLPFYSKALRPDGGLSRRYSLGLEEYDRSPEGTRGQAGRRLHWTNSTPASPSRVLIFGGPISGEGDAPEQLAWWAKHFFSEVRLEWRPDVDASIVEEFRPDIVITQTVERDLSVVPRK